jgi:hypothetical protein
VTVTYLENLSMATATKTSWADDVEELEQPKLGQDFVDENGIRTTIEYIVNDEGKKLKVRPKLIFCTKYGLIAIRLQEKPSGHYRNLS